MWYDKDLVRFSLPLGPGKVDVMARVKVLVTLSYTIPLDVDEQDADSADFLETLAVDCLASDCENSGILPTLDVYSDIKFSRVKQ